MKENLKLKKNICIYIFSIHTNITESLCCTLETYPNTINQLYFNKNKQTKTPKMNLVISKVIQVFKLLFKKLHLASMESKKRLVLCIFDQFWD